MANRNNNHTDGDFSGDDPVYSRLFVVYDRKLTKDDLEKAFSSFGHIENIKIPRDLNNEPKGVAYIKFSKTSEAANAMEAMHLQRLPKSHRPLRVVVAANRSEVERSDNDEEKYKRLFLHIPRTMTENELEEIFAKYGRLRAVSIQRDHNSGESKGFGYVSYGKFSEAALAFEECERQYRPVFAKPKQERRPKTSFESNIGMLASTSRSQTSLISMMGYQSHVQYGFTKVNFMCCPHIGPWQIERLFDLIPGMTDCQFYVNTRRNCGNGTVSYTNPTSAAYAVEKLNEFEYPPGMPIFVKFDDSNFEAEGNHYNNIPGAVSKLRNEIKHFTKSGAPDLADLAEAIAEASKIIKLATGDVTEAKIPDSNDLNYCSVNLPPPKPLADIDSDVIKRCFLVCKPAPPPLTVLRDIFCRFGDLINVYTLPNKTVGFARYASANAADEAIRVLHGAEVCGVRMKVMEAEAEAPPKKRRFNE